MRDRALLRTMLVTLSLISALSSGCVGMGQREAARESATTVSDDELRRLLEQCEDGFEATVRQATDDLLAADASRRTQRLCVLWKMQLIAAARRSLDQPSALSSMIDFWALCVRMEFFLRSGEGREFFGPNQAIAIAAAERCTAAIEAITGRVIPASRYAQADRDVDALANEFPIRGEFRTEVVRIAAEQPNELSQPLQQVLAITLAPIDALKGVDRTAAAIRGFTAVAARLTDVARELPEDVRLQAQLLALDLEQVESVREALASLRTASNSAERLAATAEGLPQAVRKELEAALDSLDARQGELRKTIAEARDTVREVQTALQQAERSADAFRETAATVEQTAANTAKAGDAWTGTFRALQEMVQSFRTPHADAAHDDTAPVSAPSDKRSFDINDYTRTAEALDAAAKQLRELTHDVRDLSGSKELANTVRELSSRVDGLIASSSGAAGAAADHLVWRLGQLGVFLFVLAIAYRLAASRLSGGRAA